MVNAATGKTQRADVQKYYTLTGNTLLNAYGRKAGEHQPQTASVISVPQSAQRMVNSVAAAPNGTVAVAVGNTAASAGKQIASIITPPFSTFL